MGHIANTKDGTELERQAEQISAHTLHQQLVAIDAEYAEAGMVWKGPGFCKARNQKQEDDYCNRKAVPMGDFCEKDTCMIRGCKEEACVWYPLLSGKPHFCSGHHKTKYTEKYGAVAEWEDKCPDYLQ